MGTAYRLRKTWNDSYRSVLNRLQLRSDAKAGHNFFLWAYLMKCDRPADCLTISSVHGFKTHWRPETYLLMCLSPQPCLFLNGSLCELGLWSQGPGFSRGLGHMKFVMDVVALEDVSLRLPQCTVALITQHSITSSVHKLGASSQTRNLAGT
jgi:hypothetical protein